MKRYLLLLVLFSFGLNALQAAIVPPDASPKQPLPATAFRTVAKKPTLKEKVVRWLLKKKVFRKWIDGEITEKQKKWAEISQTLGISSLVLMAMAFLPYVSFLAILCVPAAIVAIILGAKSLKGNRNKEGITGVVTGSITLAVIIAAVIILAILFAGFRVE